MQSTNNRVVDPCQYDNIPSVKMKLRDTVLVIVSLKSQMLRIVLTTIQVFMTMVLL